MNQQKPNANEEFWNQIQLKKSDRHCSLAHQRRGIFTSVAQAQRGQPLLLDAVWLIWAIF